MSLLNNNKRLSFRGKYIWAINLVVLVLTVYLSMIQSEKGAMVKSLEQQIELKNNDKLELSEIIFKSGSEEVFDKNSAEYGFIKPSNIVYINSDDVFLTLLR